jgi:hypothetical protein
MDVPLDMLGPLVMNGIVGEVDGAYIVTKYDAGLVHDDIQLGKQIAQPAAVCSGVHHTTVFNFCRRTGDDGLALGGPGNKCITEENTKPRS